MSRLENRITELVNDFYDAYDPSEHIIPILIHEGLIDGFQVAAIKKEIEEEIQQHKDFLENEED